MLTARWTWSNHERWPTRKRNRSMRSTKLTNPRTQSQRMSTSVAAWRRRWRTLVSSRSSKLNRCWSRWIRSLTSWCSRISTCLSQVWRPDWAKTPTILRIKERAAVKIWINYNEPAIYLYKFNSAQDTHESFRCGPTFVYPKTLYLSLVAYSWLSAWGTGAWLSLLSSKKSKVTRRGCPTCVHHQYHAPTEDV